ncbi:SLC13 family permease [Omnitrophica bacterium]|nr:SLC13 family permease [Candidatus Omnitrophota bacterium]
MNHKFLTRSIILVCAVLLISFLGKAIGFNIKQVLATGIFSISILGTILFWEFRLSFAFLGSSIMLLTGLATLEHFILSSSWDIIFFLLGMMILVAALKELGVFAWLLSRALCMKNMTAKKFLTALVFSSAIMACVVDEVSSIIFMIMIILEMSDYFEVDPIPFIIASVLATNIGSTGTVIGNPIGIFIAAKSGLTFEDFLTHSFPLMILSTFVLLGVLFGVLRKPLKEFDEKIKMYESNEFLVRLLAVPAETKLKIGFFVLGITLLAISLHHRIEILLGLKGNTVLLIIPLISSAFIMMWRRTRARIYIAEGVEWWTILFFIFLFAQSGILAQTGATRVVADKLMNIVGESRVALTSLVFLGSGIVSSFLDNVVVVAALTPVIKDLVAMNPLREMLWWILLFGACFGGNLTIIGSTANIIAIGTLEKDRKISISFTRWIKASLLPTTCTMAFVLLFFIFIYGLIYG